MKKDSRGKRKAMYNERMKICSVTLPPDMAKKIAEFGDGNLSRGIRRMYAVQFGVASPEA